LNRGLRDFNLTKSLNSIKLPTFAMTGKEDGVLAAENGHLGYSEKPEIFNEQVLEFLKNR
jgi:pimeloyl-ACP methyl ester carboxylesterase